MWLIYRCVACDQTWNCPVYERCRIGDIGGARFDALCGNDPDLVRRFALDVDWLARHADRVVPGGEVRVDKLLLGHNVPDPDGIEIQIAADEDAGIRLDRLLAAQLGLSRSQVQKLGRTGGLKAASGDLRRVVRGEAVIKIDLDAVDGVPRSSLVSAAVG